MQLKRMQIMNFNVINVALKAKIVYFSESFPHLP